MIQIKNSNIQDLLTEMTAQESAKMNGGQAEQNQQNQQGQQVSFNQQKYLQALGIAYLNPPGDNEITDKEALMAQYLGWED
ncbi:hypothetical protein [Anabaena sp. CCY 9402-a]|uniref:hypothetical protein n=1 Tax=Anabaena sp. CCY 9402-a TaxID=3103867 RepID=UPI0039C6E674